MRIGASTFLLGFALTALAALPSSATTTTSVLGIAGNGWITSTTLDFTIEPTSTPVPPPGYGSFVVLGETGLFSSSGVAPGGTGTIQSLDMNHFPPTTPFVVLGNVDLWATSAPAATGPGTDIGPFNLQDTSNGAYFTFDIDGNETTGASTTKTPFIGVFSGTFVGTTVAELLDDIKAGTAPVNPYSATFSVTTTTTTIPEPASMMLMGAGLLGVGLFSRRQTRRS